MTKPDQTTERAQAQPDALPIEIWGTQFDKENTRNPIARFLYRRFQEGLFDLFDVTRAESVLDVGCGEGHITERFASRAHGVPVVGLDTAKLAPEWKQRSAPNLSFVDGRAESLPYTADAFDVVTATEVLEHVNEPQVALAEISRVCRRYFLVSVPREPIWRILNVARGAHLRNLGNSPGHVNHWSRRAFVDLLTHYGEVLDVRSPLPWTIALVRR